MSMPISGTAAQIDYAAIFGVTVPDAPRQVTILARETGLPVQVFRDAQLAVPWVGPVITDSAGNVPGYVATQRIEIVDTLTSVVYSGQATKADVQAAIETAEAASDPAGSAAAAQAEATSAETAAATAATQATAAAAAAQAAATAAAAAQIAASNAASTAANAAATAAAANVTGSSPAGFFIPNAPTAPAKPTGGVILYVWNGALYCMGSNGIPTLIVV